MAEKVDIPGRLTRERREKLIARGVAMIGEAGRIGRKIVKRAATKAMRRAAKLGDDAPKKRQTKGWMS